MHYKKAANIVVVFATLLLVTFYSLVSYVWCGHNVRRFWRSEFKLILH